MQKRDSLLARGLDLMSPVRSCQLLSSFQIRCLIAVFLSGASALTFEILWQRQMFLIFGASAPATTAVLTAIFLGIAFGSLLAKPILHRFQRPLIAFSLMETTIGIWGFCIPFLMPLTDRLYISAAHELGEASMLLSGVRFALAILDSCCRQLYAWAQPFL